MTDYTPAFAAAKLQRPGKILGRRLMPYTLGHELLLVRLDCPLLRGELLDLGTLMTTLQILWRDFPQAEQLLRDDAKLARANRLNGWLVLKLLGPDWVKLASARILDYLIRARQQPPTQVIKSGGEASNIPLLQLVFLKLVQHGFAPSQVWQMPYREAMWHYVAIREIEGGNISIGAGKAEMEEAAKELLPGWNLVPAKAMEDAAHG